MSLADLNLTVEEAALPRDVRSFLREAGRRIRRFLRQGRLPAFVPSDYRRTYLTLRALTEDGLAPGNLFCEWGSGFGVVACLACMLDFDACGIEVEGELVDHARQLADDFGLPVEFLQGSFIPQNDPDGADSREFAWLSTAPPPCEGDVCPDEAHVVFAYPWPDEERFTTQLFERRARAGALLVTYHDAGDLRIRRKKRYPQRHRDTANTTQREHQKAKRKKDKRSPYSF